MAPWHHGDAGGVRQALDQLMNICGQQQHLSLSHVRYVTNKFIAAIGYDIFLLCAKNRIHYITIQDLGLPPQHPPAFCQKWKWMDQLLPKETPGLRTSGKGHGDLLEGPNDGPQEKAGCPIRPITLCIAKRGAMIGVWLQFNPDLSGVTGHSEQTGTQLRP